MKLTSEQLKLAQGCTSAEELLSKAQAEGFSLTLEQAEAFLGASTFTEIDASDLDNVSGGCSHHYTCYYCNQTFDGDPPHHVKIGSWQDADSYPCCDACYAQH